MAKKASKRAANGNGTIRQRPDGRWEGRFTYGFDGGSGKQIQRSVYGKSQKEVRLKLQEIAVAIERGEYIEPSKMTVEQWLNQWLESYNGGAKLSTRISYEQHCKNHIFPAIGSVKLTALRPDSVQKFVKALGGEGKNLAPKTVKNIHGILHAALKKAVFLRYINFNPADNCELPRMEKPEIHPLDEPEMIKFLAVLEDNSLFSVLMKTDLFTGLRLSEILGLQWSCIDFEHGLITVSKQLSRPRRKGDVYCFTSLKNGKSRMIKPAASVMALLKEYKKRQAEMRLQAGPVWDDGGFPDLVFTTETGGHLCYAVVERRYKKALAQAGIPERNFHTLRHSFAVASLQAGDDVKTVQENLGHYSAAFTLDVYGHVTDTMRDISSQNMERFIAGLK
ncbi:MAG: site-specific integrase [Lachnospiraceae bacterium]|nr:site-specific integrase [Lachnospiraceae bacterium]